MFLPTVLKHAPWSISKVGTIERCALAYKYKHVDRLPDESASRQSKIGVAVHAVLEQALAPAPEGERHDTDALFGKVAEEQQLTTDERDEAASFLPSVDDFVARIARFCRDKGVVKVLIEHRLAILPDFSPTTFWDKGGLMRGVIDLAMITKDGVLIILDHKTGKPKHITEHYTQFYSYMLLGAAHFPEITHVQCAVHYVGNPKLDWMQPAWSRAEIERKTRPWLVTYLNKLERRLVVVDEGAPPPEVGWQCEYCSHANICQEGLAEVARRKAKRAAASDNV